MQLFVGNLSWDTSWQDLKDHMRQAGGILSVDVMQFPDGRSKGCGIVKFDDQFSAARAIQNLTDTDLKGRRIWLREDREAGRSRPGPGRGGMQGGRGGGQSAPAFKATSGVSQSIRRSAAPDCALYIGNLPWSYKWQELKDLCKEFGDVARADVDSGPDGRSKGFGIVVFTNANDAQACIDGLNETECEGRSLSVRFDSKAGGGGQPQGGAPQYTSGGGGGGGARQSVDKSAGYKIYIGNLPWTCAWQGLKDLAKGYGDVLFADVAEEPGGRSRGFGIVSFRTKEDAYGCIDQLNGVDYEGRALLVKEDTRNPLD